MATCTWPGLTNLWIISLKTRTRQTFTMFSTSQTIFRATTEAVASCSYRCSARYVHHSFGRSGLRQRNWQTPKAYPAPVPLMADSPKDPKSTFDLKEDETPKVPRKPITKLENSEREFPDEWRRHRLAMKDAHPDGWSPPKKLSREAMDGMRFLHSQNPEIFTTPILADKFRISPEAVRRILKSKWEPSRERKQQLAEREKKESLDRIRMETLKEVKSKLEVIEEKRSADEEESELYWSKHGGPERRKQAERVQLARQRRLGGARPHFGDERRQHQASRPRMPKQDLFFA